MILKHISNKAIKPHWMPDIIGFMSNYGKLFHLWIEVDKAVCKILKNEKDVAEIQNNQSPGQWSLEPRWLGSSK